MKKQNLILLGVITLGIAACNGGNSSNSSSGGSSNVPSTEPCPNGASTCGALSAPESIEVTIPLNALPSIERASSNLSDTSAPVIKSITNLYVSSQESSFVTFKVESNGLTQPFVMNFAIQASSNISAGSPLPKFVATTSAGQAPNQCRFPANVTGSYDCTLTIAPNNAPAGMYNVVGTIENGAQPFEINVVVNYQESTSIVLPLGTYQDNSIFVLRDELDPKYGSCPNPHYVPASQVLPRIVVVTTQGVYSCSDEPNPDYPPHSLAICKGPQANHIIIPSSSSGSTINFNGRWSNNTLSINYLDFEDACVGSGLIPTASWQYQSSSQTLPYPVY